MDFFPDQQDVPQGDGDDEPRQPVWAHPPDDVLAGVVPVELVLGRSPSTVVLLSGVRAFPVGLGMKLGVRVRGRIGRRDLHAQVFDGPYTDATDAAWQAGRLKWGFKLADGRRVTNVDVNPLMEQPNQDHHRPHDADDWAWEPDHPVLSGGGGGGSPRSSDRDYWLWPLPPAGRLRVVCQWPARGIELSVHDLDGEPFLQAAARAEPIW